MTPEQKRKLIEYFKERILYDLSNVDFEKFIQIYDGETFSSAEIHHNVGFSENLEYINRKVSDYHIPELLKMLDTFHKRGRSYTAARDQILIDATQEFLDYLIKAKEESVYKALIAMRDHDINYPQLKSPYSVQTIEEVKRQIVEIEKKQND